jgi:signal transduction histidine kinase
MNDEDALKLMSHRLILATRAASIGIWDYDPIHNSLVWDDQMFRIFGIAKDQFSGTAEAWKAIVHPDDLERETRKILLAIETGEDFDSEFRIIWPDKSIRYIKANASVQRDAESNAIHMIGTNWDITSQNTTEAQLARTVVELARSNEDLAQFASVASHDLQEPLRAVAGCVELLAQGYRGKLDAEADELIRHTLEGTRRMQSLIHDLLSYSRVNTSGKGLAPTNANSALDRALDNLTSSLGESNAVVIRDLLPTLPADPTQLTQLFQNLIANGLKFHGEHRPEIKILATQKDGVWLFSVSDNGIGIEPQYRDLIFVLFQRLHSRNAYPGTGIGLAICKRIVERHGGRIWVESELGKGSTFYFTLLDQTHP